MIAFKKFIQEVVKITKVPMGTSGYDKTNAKLDKIKKGSKVTLLPTDKDYPNKTGTVVAKPKPHQRDSFKYKIKLKGVSKPIERVNYQLVGLDTKGQKKGRR